MLASRLGTFEDLTVADLFAGSGALGFEALSRGAASATFVETDLLAQKVIRANAAAFKVEDRVRLIGGSALSLPKTGPFDLIFADPPYAPGSGSHALSAIASAGWPASGGWVAIETARGERVEPVGLAIEAERDAGRARLTLLRRP